MHNVDLRGPITRVGSRHGTNGVAPRRHVVLCGWSWRFFFRILERGSGKKNKKYLFRVIQTQPLKSISEMPSFSQGHYYCDISNTSTVAPATKLDLTLVSGLPRHCNSPPWLLGTIGAKSRLMSSTATGNSWWSQANTCEKRPKRGRTDFVGIISRIFWRVVCMYVGHLTRIHSRGMTRQ